MRKTLILAAATLALGLAGQAQAAFESGNGVSLNGLETENGISSNGFEAGNGVSTNGLNTNNGIQQNVAAPRADVTLQGLTLRGSEVIHSIVMPD